MRFEENRVRIQKALRVALDTIATSPDGFRVTDSGNASVALTRLREEAEERQSLAGLRTTLDRSRSLINFLRTNAVTEDSRRLVQKFSEVVSELIQWTKPGSMGSYFPFAISDADIVTTDDALRRPEWLERIHGDLRPTERKQFRILRADRALDAHDLVGDFVDTRTMTPFGAAAERLVLERPKVDESVTSAWIAHRLPSARTPVIVTSGLGEAVVASSNLILETWPRLLEAFAYEWEDAVVFCVEGTWLLTYWHEGYTCFTSRLEVGGGTLA